ncbi:M28 family peptidase [Planctomicrobium sp. SH664]|uniref:M28 family peptidase n=1 Tax=Planctomicrobium sp. SH664 TaxID=3448125 RepID=UPI003F5AE030
MRFLSCCWVFLLLATLRPVQGAEPRVWPVDAARAFRYLEEVCAIGPRYSGSVGMQQQQELLEKHFTAQGGEVRWQEFTVPHPQSREAVRMRNLIVSFHPEKTERILIGCHYDTRPFPDRETIPANRTKAFIGANDGGSGVALFMELAHHLPQLQSRYGVDLVFFDGEELVYGPNDKYFYGSEHFAEQYRDHPPTRFRYVAGVVADMVADRDLQLFYERGSLRLAPHVTQTIWATAARLGVKEFIARRKHEVRDDHLPLNEIARIPTCDIIDFDYPHWHRRNDLPAACSGESLAKVGKVLLGWLEIYQPAP